MRQASEEFFITGFFHAITTQLFDILFHPHMALKGLNSQCASSANSWFPSVNARTDDALVRASGLSLLETANIHRTPCPH
jgi:hypothetical protein